jgi:hypothetical protein
MWNFLKLVFVRLFSEQFMWRVLSPIFSVEIKRQIINGFSKRRIMSLLLAEELDPKLFKICVGRLSDEDIKVIYQSSVIFPHYKLHADLLKLVVERHLGEENAKKLLFGKTTSINKDVLVKLFDIYKNGFTDIEKRDLLSSWFINEDEIRELAIQLSPEVLQKRLDEGNMDRVHIIYPLCSRKLNFEERYSLLMSILPWKKKEFEALKPKILADFSEEEFQNLIERVPENFRDTIRNIRG